MGLLGIHIPDQIAAALTPATGNVRIAPATGTLTLQAGVPIAVQTTAAQGAIQTWQNAAGQSVGSLDTGGTLNLSGAVVVGGTDLVLALSAKAEAVHTHGIAGVSGLQAALDAKAGLVHTHSVADVTGLQSALDAKAATTHNHTHNSLIGIQGGAANEYCHLTTAQVAALGSAQADRLIFPATGLYWSLPESEESLSWYLEGAPNATPDGTGGELGLTGGPCSWGTGGNLTLHGGSGMDDAHNGIVDINGREVTLQSTLPDYTYLTLGQQVTIVAPLTTILGPSALVAAAPTQVPVTIQGAEAQNTDLLRIVDALGAKMVWVDKNKNLTLDTGTNTGTTNGLVFSKLASITNPYNATLQLNCGAKYFAFDTQGLRLDSGLGFKGGSNGLILAFGDGGGSNYTYPKVVNSSANGNTCPRYTATYAGTNPTNIDIELAGVGTGVIKHASNATFANGLVLPTATANPASPLAGQTYFNTSDNTLRIFTGAAWKSVALT